MLNSGNDSTALTEPKCGAPAAVPTVHEEVRLSVYNLVILTVYKALILHIRHA